MKARFIAVLCITWVFVIGACIVIAETWAAEERVQSRHQKERQHRERPTAPPESMNPASGTNPTGTAPVSLNNSFPEDCPSRVHKQAEMPFSRHLTLQSADLVVSTPIGVRVVGSLRGVRHDRSRKTRTLLAESRDRFLPLARAAAHLCGLEGENERAFYAMIERESAWDAHATSESGAYGLGQLFERTGRAVSPTLSIYQPAENLIISACYLRQQIDRFGLRRGLHAYHDGPGAISRGPATPTARAYANDIIGANE